MEDSISRFLFGWTKFCLRLPGSVAAVAAGIYAYKSIKVFAAGESIAVPLTAFVFWAALSFSLTKISSMAVSQLQQT